MLLFCRVNLLVEGNRVRIFGVGIGHRIARDRARLAVDLADHAVTIAGIPGVAVLIDRHRVRKRPRIDLELRKRATLGIEACHVVAFLSHEPHASLRVE